MRSFLINGAAYCRIDQLAVGQRVDLEGDQIADPETYAADGDTSASQHPEFEFEFEVVSEIERETAGCFCVYFESGFACGFPPDHAVAVDGEQ